MSEPRRETAPDFLRSLWFMPAMFVAGSLLAGYALSSIEISDDFLLSGLIFSGTAENARQLLAVISGTMITVTGLVFVLTVIALQIASTQFSPRLLRFFLRDFGTRLVLSTFVATFAYSLAGLFTVGNDVNNGEEFLPQIAVTGALLLALISVGMLVYYIQHITNSIRIDTVIKAVEESTVQSIKRLLPDPVKESPTTPSLGDAPADSMIVPIEQAGYVQDFDLEALGRLAVSEGIIIKVRAKIGHHLVDGNAVAFAWKPDGGSTNAEAITDAVNKATLIKVERRTDHDVGYGLRQLIDVAMRAMAPSVNDPYTAVQAIHHLAVVLAALARVSTDNRLWFDDSGDVRVSVPEVPFEQHLKTVSSHLRRSAADRPRVVVALLRMLESVAVAGTTPSRRQAIAEEIELVMHDAVREIKQPADLEYARIMYDAALHAATHGEVTHTER
ncbi:MAG: DUF2254 domain-containing protein [Acidimicrobiales bacterium]|nr:DUF2254 domain-containing protein [Acidimicrobiales bacterium]